MRGAVRKQVAMCAIALALVGRDLAASPVQKIGHQLYAFISDDDHSANSTFLVGSRAILVVDTGLDAEHGRVLLAAIRKVSNLPIRYVVNTHYHPDHQGGNMVVGGATIITTQYTRDRTLQLMQARGGPTAPGRFRPADVTFSDRLTVYLDDVPAEIYFPGKAHTSGDAVVYFPSEHALATGDLFLNNSCPAMDQGSVANWITALDHMLELPLETVVPGHFALAAKSDLRRFRDYLADLYSQVSEMYKAGESLGQVLGRIHLERYS
jgi:cyclase